MAGMIHHIFGKKARAVLLAALAMAGVVLGGAGQAVADPLLDEAVEFAGAVLFLEHKVPDLVIGAMRDRPSMAAQAACDVVASVRTA